MSADSYRVTTPSHQINTHLTASDNHSISSTSYSTSYSSYSDDDESIPRNIKVLAPLGVFCLAGILGNVLFCTVVFVDRSLSKQKSNIILLLMSFGDIVVLVTRYLVTYYIEGPSVTFWPWSQTLCNLRHASPIFAQSLCIFALTACSIERYLGVVKFPLGNTTVNPWLYTIISVHVILILSFVMAGLSWWWSERPIYGIYAICMIADRSHHGYRWFVFGQFLAIYFFPLCIVCFCYFSIVRYIMKSSSMHKERANQAGVRKSLAKRKHGIILLLVITLSFALLWLPHHVTVLYLAFKDNGPPGPYEHIMALFYHYSNVANSALDPLLIFLLSSEHRNAAHDVIFCKPCCHYRKWRYNFPRDTGTRTSRVSASTIHKINIRNTSF